MAKAKEKKTEIVSVEMALTSPIKYSNKGVQEDCFGIEIVCHSKKQYKKVLFLEQLMTKAFLELQQTFSSTSSVDVEVDDDADDEDIGITKVQVVMALNLASIDLEQIYDKFETLAMTGIIQVEGMKINQPQIDEMSPEDIKGALAEYIVNFIMPSVMRSFG